MIHTVKGFGIVNKAEIDVFLELSCFFDDPADVGSLISGSSAFSISYNIVIYMFPYNCKNARIYVNVYVCMGVSKYMFVFFNQFMNIAP